jgi:hypothetical protein
MGNKVKPTAATQVSEFPLYILRAPAPAAKPTPAQ